MFHPNHSLPRLHGVISCKGRKLNPVPVQAVKEVEINLLGILKVMKISKLIRFRL